MALPLTDPEAATLLGVKPQTMRQWRCRPPKGGAPPHYRIGRLVRYDREELLAWWSSRKVRGVAA